MLRILRRTPSIQGLEICGFTPSFGVASLPSGSDCRFYSTPVVQSFYSKGWKPGVSARGVIVNLRSSEKTLLSSCISPVFSEQSRSYWTKEGRVGWRRKRSIERYQRERIMNPSSPVIDQRVPLPKDDLESLPSDLFKEDIDELGPEEIQNAQNAVMKRINDQISNRSEGRLFAVVHVSGKQFKVTPEDIIIVQDMFAPTVGDQIRLNKVLLVGGKDFTLIGSPLIDGDLIRVEATVIEKTLSYTKLHFKMIKRENYRRLKFVKTPYTMLRINLIELMQPLNMIKSESESMNHQSVNA